MSAESLSAARRWFEEVWNERREQTIDEMLPEGCTCHADEGTITGPVEFREKMYRPFVSAFPDLRVEVQGLLAEGERVAIRWSARGVHSGDGLGFPPTNEPATFDGITWVHLRDGKMQEGWQSSNIPDVVRRLAEAAGAGPGGRERERGSQ